LKKRKRHSPDQIIAKLREADVAIGRGQPLASILKTFGVSEQTYYRWRHQYGGLKAPDAKRLKELEKENARLKKLVASLALDIEMLKEVAKGNF
jgi:putative transposase